MAIWSILRPFGLFYGHLVHFTAIWSILRPFGIFYDYLEYFFPFWYAAPRKIWQPWQHSKATCAAFFKFNGRVARWYIFKPKIPIWVNIGGPWNGKCWYILWLYGILDSHLEYLTDIWYILWPFGTFCNNLVYVFPFWYVVPRQIWQPCSED
jgi:hypothetical protein